MKTFKDLFEPARDEKWKINQVKYEYNFELACEQLLPIRKRFDLTMNDYELAQNQYKNWLKNTMGYRGIGSSGINSGLNLFRWSQYLCNPLYFLTSFYIDSEQVHNHSLLGQIFCELVRVVHTQVQNYIHT